MTHRGGPSNNTRHPASDVIWARSDLLNSPRSHGLAPDGLPGPADMSPTDSLRCRGVGSGRLFVPYPCVLYWYGRGAPDTQWYAKGPGSSARLAAGQALSAPVW